MSYRNAELTAEQCAELVRLNERFARGVAAALGPVMRRKFEVSVSPSTIKSAERAERPESDLVLRIDVEPLGLTAFAAVDNSLALMLIDGFMGAPVAEEAPEARELTEIEASILEALHPVLSGQLTVAWADTRALTFAVAEQRNGLRRNHLRGTDALAAATTRFASGAVAGEMELLFPLDLVALISGAPAPTAKAPVGAPTPEEILKRLNDATVEVEAALEGSTIKLSDLLELRGGDLLRLEAAVDHPLEVRINGESRLRGSLSADGRKRALIVDAETSAESEPETSAQAESALLPEEGELVAEPPAAQE